MSRELLTHTDFRMTAHMRIYRTVIVAFVIISLVISCLIIGCSNNKNTDNGNGTPTISGELVGMLKYTTEWVEDPGTGTPYPRQTFSGFTPLIEDKSGNLYLLSAAVNSHFEYDGGALSEIIITIAGYTYTHYAPFDYEYRDVGVGEKQISYTGIQVTVTGTIDSVSTDSFSGDEINVDTIEELP